MSMPPPAPPAYQAVTQPPKKPTNWLLVGGISGGALLLGCLVCGWLLAANAVPGFLAAQVQSKVSRVRSDMRSMATAIETYYIDHNTYPVSLPLAAPSGITTPIAYNSSHFLDPFAPTLGDTLRYHTTGDGWIIWSAGPDAVYGLDWKVYNTEEEQPSDILLTQYTYDPTNGTISVGDIWRVKQ